MIIDQYYISESPIRAVNDTGLASDELEAVVGRFPTYHERRGKLRGMVSIYSTGRVVIQHHFTKKKLWDSKEGE